MTPANVLCFQSGENLQEGLQNSLLTIAARQCNPCPPSFGSFVEQVLQNQRRSIVNSHVVGVDTLGPDCLCDRLTLFACIPEIVLNRRLREREAIASENLLLTIDQKTVQAFTDADVSQETRTRVGARFDDSCGRSSLDGALGASTSDSLDLLLTNEHSSGHDLDRANTIALHRVHRFSAGFTNLFVLAKCGVFLLGIPLCQQSCRLTRTAGRHKFEGRVS